MKPFWKVLAVILAVSGGGYYWWKTQSAVKAGESAKKDQGASGSGAKKEGKGSGRRASGPVPVTTMTVAQQAMPVVIDAVGSVESEHSVAVRPQVNGTLEAVLFKEGDHVKQGQVLFRIDPRPAQATMAQATAAVARDQAQLVQAKAQEARLRPLMEKDYITRQEYDVAATLVKSLEATVDSNRAALEQARLQLSYAQISAPISGRTGSLSVRSGNLVTGGTGGAPLVVINSTQPILVSISVPQRYLDDVRRAWNTPDLKVEISPNPGAPAIASGALVFIDNAVNPTTGTIVLKARIKNDKEELWPGQFVAARIVLRIEKAAVVLPESAVQPGQDGSFVYIVKDGRAQVQKVVVDRQVGQLVVIAKGLSGGETVVGEVPATLTEGAQIVIKGGGNEQGTVSEKRKSDKNQKDAVPTEAPANEASGKK